MATVNIPKPATWAGREAKGKGRRSHAFPDGANVALCGAVKTGEQPATAPRCEDCLYESGRKSWVGR